MTHVRTLTGDEILVVWGRVPVLCSVLTYYSRIMLNAFWYLLFSKLCQHNPPNPSYRQRAIANVLSQRCMPMCYGERAIVNVLSRTCYRERAIVNALPRMCYRERAIVNGKWQKRPSRPPYQPAFEVCCIYTMS